MDQNNLHFIGRLTKEPEKKISTKGNIYAVLRVANNTRNFDGTEHTNYFKVYVYGTKRAEACCNYLTKGSQVSVVGTMVMNDMEGENGEHIRNWIVISDSVQFIGKKISQASEETENYTEESYEEDYSEEETIPFG